MTTLVLDEHSLSIPHKAIVEWIDENRATSILSHQADTAINCSDSSLVNRHPVDNRVICWCSANKACVVANR